MKTSIIILGLVALSFTNANATTEFESYDLDQQESATVNVENTQESQLVFVNQETSENTGEADAAFFNPAAAVKTAYVKTVEERIAEDKQITESKEAAFQPLALDFTKEDRIAEDNQIIESSVSDETYPLDFEKINRNVKAVIISNNAIKVTELKL